MFTGIVEDVGRVRAVRPFEGGRRLSIAARTVRDGLVAGDSVAVDGVCLTVTDLDDDGFAVDVIGTTLSRTTLAGVEPGRRVNVERALALGDRLGGHLVQGHVDALATVVRIDRRDEHVLLDLRLPEQVAEVTVLHGSLAVNGVSLTVNARPADDVAQVALIPYTWEHTNLSELRSGEPVNVEGDMIGRFVVDYLKRTGGARPAGVPAGGSGDRGGPDAV